MGIVTLSLQQHLNLSKTPFLEYIVNIFKHFFKNCNKNIHFVQIIQRHFSIPIRIILSESIQWSSLFLIRQGVSMLPQSSPTHTWCVSNCIALRLAPVPLALGAICSSAEPLRSSKTGGTRRRQKAPERSHLHTNNWARLPSSVRPPGSLLEPKIYSLPIACALC